ncbi:Sterol-4-alpha-carboxylate 3-dehydrogenase [Lachnellula suecica]|uniref:Sterol-4-alpha-carboxylate 3-dehydrogenase n=1 Tax=Lachnellula suecica TaxID=602035 RepID=A0A8T9BYB3_9HELO|nr:Sterol-4-alpha-carboxylate 3-dehydrogenase [Lachnellula suecica]
MSSESTVLIFGGCGFVGFHLVRHFVKTSTFTSVAVVSRSAANHDNHVDGATYHSGDLTDHDSIEQLLLKIKPTIIIHAASPSPVTGTPNEYEHVTIQGTKNLLKIAKRSKDVRALIYISSSALAKGPEHVNLDENHPLANTDPKSSAYARTKALADLMVLEANNPFPFSEPSVKETSWEGHLLTASLRFPIVYGTHDPTTIPGCLSALQKGQIAFQLGSGKNLWDFCSIENVCAAHSLLVQALLNPKRSPGAAKVDGEAFNIHDGSPHLFWEFARTVWKFAGHRPKNDKVTSLPAWFVLALASFLEWGYWIVTLRTKRPYNLGRQQVEYACFTHTYSIAKAKERLEFTPKQDFEGGLKEAVTWSLKQDHWDEKLKHVTLTN